MSSFKVIKPETLQKTSLCSLSVISSVLAVSLLLTAPTAAHANDLAIAEETQRLLKSLDRLKRDLDLAETNRLMSERYYGIAPPTPESVAGMPAGMGGIPASANMPQFDTSGFRLGYCTFTPSAANSFLEYAIISAGQDGIIQTSCANINAGVMANILASAPTGLNLAAAGSFDRITLSHHNETASTQWSASVDNISALPAVARVGDIRLVEDTNEIMVFGNTGWQGVDTAGSSFDEATNTNTFGNTYNTGTLTVDGQTTLRNLAVTGSSVFSNALTANGGIRADDGTLEIASTANLANGLNVTGNSLFSNLVTVNNTLDVNGLVDANSLNVSGLSTLNTTNINGVASFNNQTNFNSRTDFNSIAYFNSGLTAAGTSNFQNITATNNITTGSLNVNSNAMISGLATISALTVNGNSNLNTLNVNGAASFNNITYLNATTRASAPVHLLNGNGLYFGENFENSDTIAMYRRYAGPNRSDLVLQLGDDHGPNGAEDHFVIQGGQGGFVAIRGDGVVNANNTIYANDFHSRNGIFAEGGFYTNGYVDTNHLNIRESARIQFGKRLTFQSYGGDRRDDFSFHQAYHSHLNRHELYLQLGTNPGRSDGNNDLFTVYGPSGAIFMHANGNLHATRNVSADQMHSSFTRVHGTSEVNYLFSHGGGHINGSLGLNGDARIQTNRRVFFGDEFENTDSIYFQRVNEGWNRSVLRLHLGDDHGDVNVADQFSITGLAGHFVNIRGDAEIFTTNQIRANGSIITHLGHMYANGFHTHSDKRLKENFVRRDPTELLNKLTKVSSYNYNYIKDVQKNRIKFGVIAQEILPLFPEAVVTGDDGMLSVDYTVLGVAAATGVGHLYGQVKSLQDWQTQAANTLVNHDGRLTGLESWKTTAMNQLQTLDGRVGSLEVWQQAAQSDMELMRTIIDQNVTQIAEHALKINNLEENVADNTAEIIRLDSVLLDITDRTVNLEEQFADMNKKWADSFTVTATESGAGSSMKVNYDEFVVKNLTAASIAAKTAEFETVTANEVKADSVYTGQNKNIVMSPNSTRDLFIPDQDGHYMVTVSGRSAFTGQQYYASAVVVVDGGNIQVLKQENKGVQITIDSFTGKKVVLTSPSGLDAFGNTLEQVPSGTVVKASWLKTA